MAALSSGSSRPSPLLATVATLFSVHVGGASVIIVHFRILEKFEEEALTIMDAVQKAVTDAVQAVRNSPLLRRRFGGGRQDNTPDTEPGARALTPEKTARTPFIQGFTYNVEYLGKAAVEQGQEQDHGCTDRAVELLWSDGKLSRHTQIL